MINRDLTIESVNKFNENSAAGFLGIEFTEISEKTFRAKMPVNERTRQPFGLLHGGISAALAETVGSVAGNAVLEDPKLYCVGTEINCSHLRSVAEGWVFAEAKPLHIGRRTQVWDIRITDEQGRTVCVSRLSLAVAEIR